MGKYLGEWDPLLKQYIRWEIGSEKARQKLPMLLTEIPKEGRPAIITRYGVPMCAMIAVEDLE